MHLIELHNSKQYLKLDFKVQIKDILAISFNLSMKSEYDFSQIIRFLNFR